MYNDIKKLLEENIEIANKNLNIFNKCVEEHEKRINFNNLIDLYEEWPADGTLIWYPDYVNGIIKPVEKSFVMKSSDCVDLLLGKFFSNKDACQSYIDKNVALRKIRNRINELEMGVKHSGQRYVIKYDFVLDKIGYFLTDLHSVDDIVCTSKVTAQTIIKTLKEDLIKVLTT